jgi:hypothetical protein
MTLTPPAPIVPALVTPPLKVAALITIALVWPLNLVGYGPVNAMKFPNALSGHQSARTIPPVYAVEPLPILAVIVSIRWLGMRALSIWRRRPSWLLWQRRYNSNQSSNDIGRIVRAQT